MEARASHRGCFGMHPTWLTREVQPAQLRPVPRAIMRALMIVGIAGTALTPSIASIVLADHLSMMPTVALEEPRATGQGTGSYSPSATRHANSNNFINRAIFLGASGAQSNTAMQTDSGDVILNVLNGTTTIGDAYTTTPRSASALSPEGVNYFGERGTGNLNVEGDLLVHGRIRLVDEHGGEITFRAYDTGRRVTFKNGVRR